MELIEKHQLVKLLQIYQNEQIETQLENVKIVKNARAKGKSRFDVDIKYGCKAKYEHARILSTNISREINKEIPSFWGL